MSKRMTYIGNVGADSFQHIIRTKAGRLVIAKHHRAGDYIEFSVGNIGIAIPHTRQVEISLRCTSWASRSELTEAIEIAQFVFANIKERHNEQ